MYRRVKRAGQFGTFTDDEGPQTVQWLVVVVESLITVIVRDRKPDSHNIGEP